MTATATTGRPCTTPTRVDDLWLVRHGESAGNVAREEAEAAGADRIDVAWRDPDVPLSGRGREQAARVGPALPGDVDRLWTSTYARARETAELATAGRGYGAAWADERLRDRELGVLDLLTGRGSRARFPEEAERRRWLGKFAYRPPGGESWADLTLRLRSWLGDAGPGRCVVVAHDAVVLLLRAVVQALTEAEILELARAGSVGNASVSHLRRDEDGLWHVETWDDQDHLGPLATRHAADARDLTPGVSR